MDREWKKIEGFDNYSISNDGLIWNDRRNKQKSQRVGSCGYSIVSLYKDGKPKTISIHRLVANAFVSNPDPISKTDINHKDGNKLNNNFLNLEWVTKSENMIHAFSTGLNKPHPTYGMLGKKNPNGGRKGQQIRIIETGEIYESISKCADAIGGRSKSISDAINGWSKTHKGFHFERIT